MKSTNKLPKGQLVQTTVEDNYQFAQAGIDKRFIVEASAGIRGGSGDTILANGTTIAWELLNDTNHASSFFETIYPRSQAFLGVGHPLVKRIIKAGVLIDEYLAFRGIVAGGSFRLGEVWINAGTVGTARGEKLTGDGASGWTMQYGDVITSTITAGITSFNTIVHTAFLTEFGKGITTGNTNSVNISYVGLNNYRVQRVFDTNLGSFKLIDNATNTEVTTYTTDDVVLINNLGLEARAWSFKTVNKDNKWISFGSSNFILEGTYEVYIKATPISDTEMSIIWQDYDGVIERATDAAFTTPVSLNNATTDRVVIDSGLTPNTLYYYRITGNNAVRCVQSTNKTL